MDKCRHPPDSLAALEAKIRSARDYVHPTDDLRPRTLESASERGALRRGRRLVLALVLAFLMAPAMHTLAARRCNVESKAFVSAQDLHAEAQRFSLRTGTDAGWGLIEAFRLMRHEQATRLGAEVSEL